MTHANVSVGNVYSSPSGAYVVTKATHYTHHTSVTLRSASGTKVRTTIIDGKGFTK